MCMLKQRPAGCQCDDVENTSPVGTLNPQSVNRLRQRDIELSSIR